MIENLVIHVSFVLLSELVMIYTISFTRNTCMSMLRKMFVELCVPNKFRAFSALIIWCFISLINWWTVYIDWFGLRDVFKTCLVSSRRPVRLPSCFLAFSYQYSTQQSFQATGCFSTLTLIPLVGRRLTLVVQAVVKLRTSRMMVEIMLELTAPGLRARVATNLASGARLKG